MHRNLETDIGEILETNSSDDEGQKKVKELIYYKSVIVNPVIFETEANKPYLDAIKKALEKFEMHTLQGKGLSFKKVVPARNIKGKQNAHLNHPAIYSARITGGVRLLLTFIMDEDGNLHLLPLELFLSHDDYDAAISNWKSDPNLPVGRIRSQSRHITEHLNNLNRQRDLSIHPIQSEKKQQLPQAKPNFIPEFLSTQFDLADKPIIPNESQKKVLELSNEQINAIIDQAKKYSHGLIEGPAGSGKSTAAMLLGVHYFHVVKHMAKRYEKRFQIIYLVPFELLKNRKQEEWNAFARKHKIPVNCVKFRTTKEQLALDYPDITFTKKKHCMDWIVNHIEHRNNNKWGKNIKLDHTDNKTIKMIFAEFSIIAAFTDKNKYMNRKTLFEDKNIKNWLWKSFEVYKKPGVHIRAFMPFKHQENTLLIADEAHAIPAAQIKSLCKQEIIHFITDRNQITQFGYDNLNFIKTCLKEETGQIPPIIQFPFSYRVPLPVMPLVYKLQELMDQKNEIQGTEEHKNTGKVVWLSAEKRKELTAYMQSRNTVDIGVVIKEKEKSNETEKRKPNRNEEAKPDPRDEFNTPLVSTAEKSGGMEYQAVIVDDIFDIELLKELNKELRAKKLNKDKSQYNEKEEKIKTESVVTNELMLFYKRFLIAITRTTNTLVICVSDETQREIPYVIDFLKEGVPSLDNVDSLTMNEILGEIKESTEEDWLKLIEQSILSGKKSQIAQANKIYVNKLKKSEDEFNKLKSALVKPLQPVKETEKHTEKDTEASVSDQNKDNSKESSQTVEKKEVNDKGHDKRKTANTHNNSNSRGGYQGGRFGNRGGRQQPSNREVNTNKKEESKSQAQIQNKEPTNPQTQEIKNKEQLTSQAKIIKNKEQSKPQAKVIKNTNEQKIPDKFSTMTDLQYQNKLKFHDALYYGTVEDLKTLVNEGVDVNFEFFVVDPKDDNNHVLLSPLHLCIQNDKTDMVEFLLSLPNIDVNKEAGEGCTPLIRAIYNKNLKIVELLLARSDLDINKKSIATKKYPATATPLSFALINESEVLIEMLNKDPRLVVCNEDIVWIGRKMNCLPLSILNAVNDKYVYDNGTHLINNFNEASIIDLFENKCVITQIIFCRLNTLKESVFDFIITKPEYLKLFIKCLMKENKNGNLYLTKLLQITKSNSTISEEDNKSLNSYVDTLLSTLNGDQIFSLLNDVCRTMNERSEEINNKIIANIKNHRFIQAITALNGVYRGVIFSMVPVTQYYLKLVSKDLTFSVQALSDFLMRAVVEEQLEILDVFLKLIKYEQVPQIDFDKLHNQANGFKGNSIKNKLNEFVNKKKYEIKNEEAQNQKLIFSKNTWLIGECIKKEMDFNIKFNGLTPLHIAIREQNLDLVKTLLKSKTIDVNALTSSPDIDPPKDALALAAEFKNIDILSLLINDEKINIEIIKNNIKNRQSCIIYLLNFKIDEFKDDETYKQIQSRIDLILREFDLSALFELFDIACTRGTYQNAMERLLTHDKMQMTSLDMFNQAIDLNLDNVAVFCLSKGLKVPYKDLNSLLEKTIEKNNFYMINTILENETTQQGIVELEIDMSVLHQKAIQLNRSAIAIELGKYLKTPHNLPADKEKNNYDEAIKLNNQECLSLIDVTTPQIEFSYEKHVKAHKIVINNDTQFEFVGTNKERSNVSGIEVIDISNKKIEEQKSVKRLQLTETQISELFSAVSAGNVEVIKKFINAGLDVNEEFPSSAVLTRHRFIKSFSLLHLAISYKQTNLATFLLAQPKIDVNKRDDSGFTPLHYAMSTQNVRIIEQLLMREELNINKKSIIKPTNITESPLSFALDIPAPNIIDMLCKDKRLEVSDEELTAALKNEDLPKLTQRALSMKYIFNKGTNLINNFNEDTIINLFESKLFIKEILFHNIHVFNENKTIFMYITRNPGRMYPFIQCAMKQDKNGKPYIIDLLRISEELNSITKDFSTYFDENILANLNIKQLFVVLDSLIKIKNAQNGNIFKRIIEQPSIKFLSSAELINQAIDLNLEYIVKYFLQLEARLSYEELNSFLEKAIEKNYLSIVKIILADGATQQAVFNMGINLTQLYQKATELNHQAIANELKMSRQASGNPQANKPSHSNTRGGHQHGRFGNRGRGGRDKGERRVNQQANQLKQPREDQDDNKKEQTSVKRLQLSKIQISELYKAVRTGNVELIKKFINTGLDVNEEFFAPSSDFTQSFYLLDLAIANNQSNLVKFLLSQPNLDVNKRDGNGFTTLHRAIERQNPDIIQSLLNRNDLDINKESGGTKLNDSESSVRFALEIQVPNIVNMLCKDSRLVISDEDFVIAEQKSNELPESTRIAVTNKYIFNKGVNLVNNFNEENLMHLFEHKRFIKEILFYDIKIFNGQKSIFMFITSAPQNKHLFIQCLMKQGKDGSPYIIDLLKICEEINSTSNDFNNCFDAEILANLSLNQLLIVLDDLSRINNNQDCNILRRVMEQPNIKFLPNLIERIKQTITLGLFYLTKSDLQTLPDGLPHETMFDFIKIAIHYGHFEILELLLKNSATKLNEEDLNKLLIEAVTNENLKILDALLNVIKFEQLSQIDFNSLGNRAKELKNEMIDNKLNEYIKRKKNERTIIQTALLKKNTFLIGECIKKDFDFNLKFDGLTPLHIAISEQNVQLVKTLLTSKTIDLNVLTSLPNMNAPKDALTLAAETKNINILCLLVTDVRIDIKNIEKNIKNEQILYLLCLDADKFEDKEVYQNMASDIFRILAKIEISTLLELLNFVCANDYIKNYFYDSALARIMPYVSERMSEIEIINQAIDLNMEHVVKFRLQQDAKLSYEPIGSFLDKAIEKNYLSIVKIILASVPTKQALSKMEINVAKLHQKAIKLDHLAIADELKKHLKTSNNLFTSSPNVQTQAVTTTSLNPQREQKATSVGYQAKKHEKKKNNKDHDYETWNPINRTNK